MLRGGRDLACSARLSSPPFQVHSESKDMPAPYGAALELPEFEGVRFQSSSSPLSAGVSGSGSGGVANGDDSSSTAAHLLVRGLLPFACSPPACLKSEPALAEYCAC